MGKSVVGSGLSWQVVLVCLVGVSLLVTSSDVEASLVLHANDSMAQLYTVDVGTAQATLIGSTGQVFTDIAFDPDGNLFGIGSLSGNMNLFQIDPCTAATTLIGPIGLGGYLNALVFDTTGVLLSTSDQDFITIDPTTGQGTLIASTIDPYGSAGDLAFDTAGNLFLTTDSGHLVMIDQGDGSITPIGLLPDQQVYGFARDSLGDMWGITSDNMLLSVNILTGAGTALGVINPIGFPLGNTNGCSFIGEAIPEPHSLLLVALGAAAISRRKRRS